MENENGARLPVRSSHGSGKYDPSQFHKLGENVIIEEGVLIFHPENIELGNHIYIGHYTILKGYYQGKMVIGDGTWIGQQCFFHSAGNLLIGKNVGIGPGVKIITSVHMEEGLIKPILHSKVEFAPVVIEDNADIGIGAIILPGVTIAKGTQVGAGAVVTKNFPEYAVLAGIPAQVIRFREG